ncbi:PAS/PAC sensor signal transduction histidine kinase [Methanolobus psychrophilus R15]|nr:PAS/PAC sensor signal transduction histidine kinase [Methanolobus psychrophilus R15]
MDNTGQRFDSMVLQDAPVGICIFDKDDNFVFFNKEMESISGMSSCDVIGKSLFHSIPDYTLGGKANFRQFYLDTKHSLQRSSRQNVPIITPNNILSYQSISLVPLFGEDGSYYGMVCYVEEVSDYCLRERGLLDKLSDVDKLESIYREVPVIVLKWSSEEGWPVLFVSENISQLGYTKEELESENMHYIDMIHPQDRAKLLQGMSRFTEEGEAYFSHEYRLLRKTGEFLWVRELSLLHKDEQGKPLRFEGIILDISDKKKYEEELEKHTAELEQLNALKDLFSDIIRHDLLTPAGTIKGYVEILQEMESDKEKLNLLKVIEASTKRLIDLIESASKYEKLNSIDEIDYYYTDLVNLFRSTLLDFTSYSQEKNTTLNLSSEGPCYSNVNPLVSEVFANLLSNAVKYSPENGRIDISFLTDADTIRVTVTDQGDGIPDENKTSVFNRFKRLEKKGVKGTGLGLAIVKRIMEMHCGGYGVEDNPDGKGSVFWVTFSKAACNPDRPKAR